MPSLPSVLSAAAIGIGVSFALYIFRRPRIRIAKSVYLQGMGDLKVIKQTVGNKIHVTLDFGVPKLPFCSAVVTAAGTIYVSGAVGAKMDGGRLMVVPGWACDTHFTLSLCQNRDLDAQIGWFSFGLPSNQAGQGLGVGQEQVHKMEPWQMVEQHTTTCGPCGLILTHTRMEPKSKPGPKLFHETCRISGGAAAAFSQVAPSRRHFRPCGPSKPASRPVVLAWSM